MGFSTVLSLVLEMVSMSIPYAQILGASSVLSDAVTARPDDFGQGDDHDRALLRGRSIMIVLFAALVGVSAAPGGQVC